MRSRVLIAEDNALLRGVLRMALEQEGIQVLEEASDGVEAVALLDAGLIPDVYLMNGKMPNMDGWEATARISHSYPDVPVLINTAYDEPRMVEVSREVGARGHLKQGIALEEFIEAIRYSPAAARSGPSHRHSDVGC